MNLIMLLFDLDVAARGCRFLQHTPEDYRSRACAVRDAADKLYHYLIRRAAEIEMEGDNEVRESAKLGDSRTVAAP